MTRLVFLDTETTGLSLDADIWEIGLIVRDPDTDADVEHHLFVEHDPAKVAGMPERFRDDLLARYRADARDVANNVMSLTREFAAHAVHAITSGAHVVGAVPNFDTERLAILLREHDLEPGWHYHLIDVEVLVVGYLAALAHQVDGLTRTASEALGLDPDVAHDDHAVRAAIGPPWRSDDLAAAVGVSIAEEDRHTALGDARWARDIYDTVMGGLS